MTGFFHVPTAFGVLEKEVIPALFEDKSSNDLIRVWVAGCATGEEAYSVAILLFQYASTLEAPPRIEIFATDNDKNALEQAKRGIYPAVIQSEMSQMCLDRYFVKDPAGFAVVPEVKGSVLFSSHDVLIDNSFQSFDLITCRHLLGNLEKSSQTQIITFFRHSLKPGGFIFLGDAELMVSLPGQYEAIDEEFRIFRLLTNKSSSQTDISSISESQGKKDSEESESMIGGEEDLLYMELDFSSPEDEMADEETKEYPTINEPAKEESDVSPEGSKHTLSQRGIATKGSTLDPGKPEEVKRPTLRDLKSDERFNGTLFKQPKQVKESQQTSNNFLMHRDSCMSYHRKTLLAEYAPASVIIDRSYSILDYTDKTKRIFKPDSQDLVRDYLDLLSKADRIRLQETIDEAFDDKDTEERRTINLSPPHGMYDVVVSYVRHQEVNLEYVHLVFAEQEIKNEEKTQQVESPLSFDDYTIEISGEGADNDRNAFDLESGILKVVASAPYPILIHAEGGHIIESSPAWFHMAGVSREEAPTISDWIKKVKGQRLRLKDSKLKKAYEKKGVVCIAIRTMDDDTKLLAFHSYLLGKDHSGRRLTLTIAMDLTNYPAQVGLESTPESIDFGVSVKNTILANMSHEIRTPLTSMIGFADYLSEIVPEDAVPYTHYISQSGNHLLETLNSILRIASLGGIGQALKPEWFDLAFEIESVLDLLKPRAKQGGLTLSAVAKRPVHAKLDRAAFRRIMVNLIDNAIKFTPDGSVDVAIEGDNDSVIVHVEDTGIGISDEFLPFIFDRFRQEAEGESRTQSGVGSGLAITRELVEAMGGSIHVDTKVAVGSKFTVTLPKHPQSNGQHKSEDYKDDVAEEDTPVRPHILVVEDNPDTQELMLLILRDKYSVDLTSCASETLKMVSAKSFDLILMDLNLGERQTGIELLQELRKVSAFEGVPVLAVSALPLDMVHDQLIEGGFSGYISKPFTRARLLDTVEGTLTNNES